MEDVGVLIDGVRVVVDDYAMAVTIAELCRGGGTAFGVAAAVHTARPNLMLPEGALVATVAPEAYKGLEVGVRDDGPQSLTLLLRGRPRGPRVLRSPAVLGKATAWQCDARASRRTPLTGADQQGGSFEGSPRRRRHIRSPSFAVLVIQD